MEEKHSVPVSIRRVLDKELCDKLVRSTSLTIGRNVLITDENGYVVASNIKDREETFHEASIEVIKSGKNAYHDEEACRKIAGTRPGMTIPLLVEDQVIGTVGISGDPQDVSRYGALVQQMTQIFMSFQSRQQTSARIGYRQLDLLREIIAYDERISRTSEIYSLAYELGIDLRIPRAAVLLRKVTESGAVAESERGMEDVKRLLERFFPGPQDFVCRQNDGTFVLFACIKDGGISMIREGCRQIGEELKKEGQLQIGIGIPANDLASLRKSYEDASFALRVIRTGVRKENCLASEDLGIEKLAVSLPEDVCASVQASFPEALFRSHRYNEIMELLDSWCRLGFHFTKTAEELHIHKSTLIYRFQRIQEVHGLDLYDFNRIIPLFLLSVRRRLL